MQDSVRSLAHWTKEQIDSECRASYVVYERELIAHYASYFEKRSHLRCLKHSYSARTIATALPPGYSHLTKRIPTGSLHRFCRSGRSSQMLGLSLLCSALEQDRSLWWFWTALELPKRLAGLQNPVVKFEHALAPADLGEMPRTTKLDLSLATDEAFVAIETKWSEAGLGSCSCAREGEGDPRVGFECAPRVYARTAYWNVANQVFSLASSRLSFLPCDLSPAYQAVRNVAAAIKLAGSRVAVFVLLFDQNNPYFRPTGRWPGWPAFLNRTLRKHSAASFLFRAISWQSLISNVSLPASVRLWAREKHRL